MTITANIEEATDLQAYRKDWESLFLQGAHEPSSSYEWTAALLKHHLRANDRVWILVLRDAGTTVGLVPLVASQERILGLPLVSLSPLSERYNTHGELLTTLDTDACAQAFVSALAALPDHWDVFRMGRLLETDPLVENLAVKARRLGTTPVVRFRLPSFFMSLPEFYPEYLAQRSSKFRNHLRRVEKRLLARGSFGFSVVTALADFETAYANILDIESHSWKHQHGTAISANARQTAFYRDMCRGAAEVGRLHLSFLYLRDQPIAYNMGYLHNQRYYYLKTSYHEAFRMDGVATYARARLIERLIGAGVRAFDFPGEPYEWEQQWASELRWHQTISIYNKTLPAQLYLNLWRLRRSLSGHDSSDKVLKFFNAKNVRAPSE